MPTIKLVLAFDYELSGINEAGQRVKHSGPVRIDLDSSLEVGPSLMKKARIKLKSFSKNDIQNTPGFFGTIDSKDIVVISNIRVVQEKEYPMNMADFEIWK